MVLHKREEVDNKKKSLVTIHSKPLINDSNYFFGIGKGKVMNSAHGHYGHDILSLLYPKLSSQYHTFYKETKWFKIAI
jgi:hypothetical protein